MNRITKPYDEEITRPQESALADERQRVVFSEYAYFAIQAAISALQRTVSAFAETPETSLNMASSNRRHDDLPAEATARLTLVCYDRPGNNGGKSEPRVEADICVRLPGRPSREIVVSVLCLADGSVIPVPKHT